MSGATLSGGGLTGNNSNNVLTGGVELCETGGRALKLQADTPHLVSLGGGRLSTAVTLHPIPQGRVTLGSGPNVDIPVHGTGVQALHCHIENSSGVVTLYPQAEQISIDGVRVTCPTRLSQGVMLTIGRSNYMRFNHPAEAKLMKSVLPNSRISMAPISFEPQDNYSSKFNKKPPVAPRKSPRDLYSDIDEPNCIMSKVSKFEYLAAQNALKSVSPKVFSSNLVTVNTPAKDVLGKAPPNLQNFTKNLSQPAVNYTDNSVNYNDKNHLNKNKTPDRPVFGRKSPSQYVNVTVNDTSKNCNNRVVIHENGCIPKHQNTYMNVSLDSSHFAEMNNLNNKNCGSNQSLKNVGVNNFPRITTPSPSFNRNPSPYYRSVTPSPIPQKPLDYRTGSVGELNSQIRGVSGSIEDLTQRNNEAELRRNQAYVERKLEEEAKRKEQQRLEEIVNMCAEYEKQAQWEKNNKPTQNRIKTNGSLPREKRQCASPSQTSNEQMFHFETNDQSTNRDNKSWDRKKNNVNQYENVSVNQFQQVIISSTPNIEHNSNSLRYENVEISNLSLQDVNSPYENIVVSSNGSSPSPYPQSPRTRIKTYLHSSHKESTPKENNEFAENNKLSLDFNQDYDLCEQYSPKETPTDNTEISETPKRKITPQKFILPIEIENSTSTENKMKEKLIDIKHENEKARIEKLKKEKRDIMCIMVTIKRKIADIEIQEEELFRELEMEKALLTGEHQSNLGEMEREEKFKEKLLQRAKQIELKMEECRITQNEHQEACKKKLEIAYETVQRIEYELSKISKTSSTYPDLLEELAFAREQLENERKAFEDLEFHHLEEEADWLASREELQREILDLSQKIEIKKQMILDLEGQKNDTLTNTTQESRSLQRQLHSYMRKLEDCRQRLTLIDSELQTYSDRDSDNEISSDSENEKLRNSETKLENLNLLKNQLQSMSLEKPKHVTNSLEKHKRHNSPKKVDDVFNMSQSFNEKLLQEKSILDFDESIGKKCPSQDDIDRISKVTSNAPINFEEGRGSLGKKTIESLKEIERNRHLHLAQQGSQVIELERRRMMALKQRAQDEVRTQWAQNRHKDCTSLNSTGSEETHLDSVSGSDDIDKRNSEATTSGNEQNQPDSLKLRSESEGADSPRPLSESSEMSCDTGISEASPQGSTLNRRPKTRPSFNDKHRPLTRYLPIRSAELDLRKHIETAGHQVDLCQHVALNSTTCKGFLHKMGSKLHGWRRRWFVFDRTKRTLVYYSDKNEKKPRGGAYFQAIEEVYLDHQNSVKSPNPHLTFIIKTHERSYHLMAPSPEAMRIWVDVVFTGAEGYQEFEHGT